MWVGMSIEGNSGKFISIITIKSLVIYWSDNCIAQTNIKTDFFNLMCLHKNFRRDFKSVSNYVQIQKSAIKFVIISY